MRDREDFTLPIALLCGSIAHFDYGSGCAHRCEMCNAIVGSVGMPRHCKELYEIEQVVNKLKGKNENANI